jgi:hypothetical protein
MKSVLVLSMVFGLLLAFGMDQSAEAQTEEAVEDPSVAGPRDLRRDCYLEIGANLGWPALINGAIGHWFGPIGLRLSGMYWGDEKKDGRSGVQCDVAYKLSDNANTLHSLAVAGGACRESCCDWSYWGAAYSLSHKWFFLEVGWAKRVENRSEARPQGSYQPIIQMGYTHRFLPH